MLSDAELVAARNHAAIIDRHRAPLVECLTERFGDSANMMADAVLEDSIANLAAFDPYKHSFFCWMFHFVSARHVAARLIAAGHCVSEAGQFAAVKADTLSERGRVTDVRWLPDVDHPTNSLFRLIDLSDDVQELNEIADYIAQRTSNTLI